MSRRNPRRLYEKRKRDWPIDIGALVVIVLLVLVGIKVCGCAGPGPRPSQVDPHTGLPRGVTPMPMREVGPGFVKDPDGMRLHDIDPERDLTYLGAFSLPSALDYSEGAKEYYRYGNTSNGTLLCTGHLVDMDPQLFEVTIPQPYITRNYAELPRARVLQSGSPYPCNLKLKDVEFWWRGEHERLHGTLATHYEYTTGPRFFACRLTLADPQTKGLWELTPASIEVNQVLFQLPEPYANKYTEGRRLCCGRHRDGQVGPTLYAYSPYDSLGNLVANGTLLPVTTLLRYDGRLCSEPGQQCIVDHCEDDTYRGAAYLEDGPRRAFVFIRRKGMGRCWYGYPDGTECPPVCDCQPADCGGNRGYQADWYEPQFVFFRPRDLAMVAQGHWPPYRPQPYAVLDLTPYFLRGVNPSGLAYCPQTEVPPDDPHAGWLFVTEEGAYGGYKPVIHVWKVGRT